MEQKATPSPRPLALHLAIQNLIFASSLFALPSLKSGSIAWKPPLGKKAAALRARLETVDDDRFRAAVTKEINTRLAAFAAGVDRFNKAPRPGSMPDLPSVWDEGTTRLLHAPPADAGDGPPVLLVPSLINRAHILDLAPDRSLVRHFAERGLDAYLVDWDGPGDTERTFSVDDYIDRLERVRDHIVQTTGRAPMLVGYCMGGLLALALAHRAPDKVAALALLATPWDFHATAPAATAMLAASMPALRSIIATFGVLPVDVLQAMFASLDPGGTIRKFRRFAGLTEGPGADAFVELEDWLNDGVPLAGPVAVECLADWYVDNKPFRGTWINGGRAVDPGAIDVPALVVVPTADVIVPPASALPLGTLLKRAETVRVDAGHIGMAVGSKALPGLYEPLATWLSDPRNHAARELKRGPD